MRGVYEGRQALRCARCRRTRCETARAAVQDALGLWAVGGAIEEEEGLLLLLLLVLPLALQVQRGRPG